MVCETIGRARAGRDPQHARVPLRRFTPCEHRAVILQPVRLSSFTAISISSATRIPQETCWIPQETCLLAKKALVGFRKKLACWRRKASVACSLVPTLRALSRVLALRALSFRGTLHPPRLPPELFCVRVCVPGREGFDGYGRRDPTVTSCPRLVSCMSLLIHIRALRSREEPHWEYTV